MAYLLSASLCMEFGANMVLIESSFLLSNAQLLLMLTNYSELTIYTIFLFASMLEGCSICHVSTVGNCNFSTQIVLIYLVDTVCKFFSTNMYTYVVHT